MSKTNRAEIPLEQEYVPRKKTMKVDRLKTRRELKSYLDRIRLEED